MAAILQSFLVALNMLRLNKMRAFLTMLGVIIGVFSVTIVIMISQGFQAYLKNQFAKIGSDTIYISYDPWRIQAGETLGAFSSLTTDDMEFLKERVPDVVLASGYREAGNTTAKGVDREVKNVATKAVDANFVELNRVKLLAGRYLSKEDMAAQANVCIVSEKVAENLYGSNEKALGQVVNLGAITLEIVGVTEKLELMGQRNENLLLLPLTTANQKWLGDRRVDLILARAKPGRPLNDVMDEIWRVLMAKSGNKVVYSVDSSENVLKVFQGVVGAAGGVLSGIAALSLLVGGIGIMNIMLVSVTERTREIGLRKAVGAKKVLILMQFLIEAATLSMVGGFIGMTGAYMIGLAITALTKVQKFPDAAGLALPFPLGAALGAMIFSAFIGMAFGFFPAVRAANMDPIVALRTE
jgi:putative ABC transport system permease protein